MNTNNLKPKWMRRSPPTEEERVQIEKDNLQKLRDDFAEILVNACPKRMSDEYYSDLSANIEENMEYINKFIEDDNIRLRDQYLTNEIERLEKLITTPDVNYAEEIKKYTQQIKNNEKKINFLLDQIPILSEELNQIKLNKPYVAKSKQRDTPEEIKIKEKISSIPHEKNNLEEINEKLAKDIIEYESLKESYDATCITNNSQIEYIQKNWDKYSVDGCHIVLPRN
jgi:hypothetical protein